MDTICEEAPGQFQELMQRLSARQGRPAFADVDLVSGSIVWSITCLPGW